MLSPKKVCKLGLILSIMLCFGNLIGPYNAGAVIIKTTTTTATIPVISPTDNWTALPPYNTLWPIWSPVLSPISSVTGLPAPLVTSLTPTTVLPVQPGLTWDPSLGYPWLLYNTPLGLAYYDPYAGVDLWPPDTLINSITGNPITLSLPVGYPTLSPTPPSWLFSNVASANQSYVTSYASFALPNTTPPPLTSLLTALQLLL